MNVLLDLIARIVERLLSRHGGRIGRTEAADATVNRGLLGRAGSRINDWVQSRNAGRGGKPDADRP